MRKLFAVLIVGLIAAGIAPVHAQDDWTAPYRPAMLPGFAGDMQAYTDAPRYTIDMILQVAADGVTITGREEVVYTHRGVLPLNEIVFRLYPNLPSFGGEMSVFDAMVGGRAVEPQTDDTQTILTIPLPEPLATGASTEISLRYTLLVIKDRTPLYGQFSYMDGILTLPNAYPVLSVYEAGRGWWQVTDHPQGDAVFSETAFYTVSITAPPKLIVAASGSEVDLVVNADGTLTHRYVAPLMRDFALMASESYVTLSGEQDGVRITIYYVPASSEATLTAQAGLQMAQDMVRIFNAAFGAYPFAELDIVQTTTSVGGIEYPGLFVVGREQWDRTNSYFEFVIIHEGAHQWWYSLVGNDQTLHPWMDEALAQYSAAVYIRTQEGETAYDAALESFRIQHDNFIAAHPGQISVIGEPVVSYPGLAYFYVVYQKGPLMFAALEDTYGYDTTLHLLKNYFATYRYGIAVPGDMLSSFEVTLGENLDALFAEWVGGDDFAVG